MIQHHTRSIPSLLLTGWLSLALTGCGSGLSGPQRHDIRGQVTYAGKPIPKGQIRFTPDDSKGNSGPGAIAEIDNGVYQTESGKGVVSGPHVVLITGLDGIEVPDAALPNGAALFKPFTIQRDLEDESASVDFEVPLQKDR